jgi:hypothetical protein
MHRRMALEYLLVVGLPLGLLVLTLHRSRDLAAPAAVAGAWSMRLLSSETECPNANEIGVPDSAMLSIEQSGRYIEARIDSSSAALLRGRVSSGAFWLETAGVAPASGGLRLAGVRAPSDGGETIRGALLRAGRTDCPPISFEASRAAPAQAKRTMEH